MHWKGVYRSFRNGEDSNTSIVCKTVLRKNIIESMGIIYHKKQQVIAFANAVTLSIISKTEFQKNIQRNRCNRQRIIEDKTTYCNMKAIEVMPKKNDLKQGWWVQF